MTAVVADDLTFTITGTDGAANPVWSAAGAVSGAPNGTWGATGTNAITLDRTLTDGAATTTSTLSFTAVAGAGYSIAITGATDGGTTATIQTTNGPAITSVSAPEASRAGGLGAYPAQTIDLTGTALPDEANINLNVCMVSGPTNATFTPGTQIASNENGDTTEKTLNLGFGSAAGNYLLGVYWNGAVGGTVCENGVARATSILINSFSHTYGGAIAAVTQTPASLALVNGSADDVTVQATDAAGRRTLPTSVGDNLTPDSVGEAVATVGALTIPAATGVMTYEVAAQGAGTTQVSIIPQNLSVTPAVTSVTVGSQGGLSAASTVSLAQAGVVRNAGTTRNSTWTAGTTVSLLTFRASSLVPGATYVYGVTTNDVGTVVSPTGGVITANAAGEASVQVGVTGIDAGRVVTFTVNGVAVGAGGVATISAAVTYATAGNIIRLPVADGVIFGAASSAVTVPVLVTDQFGTPLVGAGLDIENAAGASVATGTTGADGSAALQVTAPATGSATFTLTVQGIAAARTFSVSTASPTVTITSLGDAAVNPNLPVVVANPAVGATVVYDNTWTGGNGVRSSVGQVVPVEATVTVNGAPVANALVSFQGAADGVHFLTAATNGISVPWNAGNPTATGVTGAAGQAARVFAYSIKTGVNTFAAAASASAAGSGSFVVRNDNAAAARNVTVQAPAGMDAGGSTVLTVTVTDNFGNPVNAEGATTLRIAAGSPGFFATGVRSVDVDTDSAGRAQVVLLAGANETGTIEFTAGARSTTAAGVADRQFNAPASRLTFQSVTNDAPGFTASNAPVTIKVEIGVTDKSIVVSGYRSGSTVVVEGDATGFSRGDSVKLEIRTYNTSKKKWSKWREKSTAVIKSNGLFTGSVTANKKVRVRASADGIRSNVVTVPRA